MADAPSAPGRRSSPPESPSRLKRGSCAPWPSDVDRPYATPFTGVDPRSHPRCGHPQRRHRLPPSFRSRGLGPAAKLPRGAQPVRTTPPCGRSIDTSLHGQTPPKARKPRPNRACGDAQPTGYVATGSSCSHGQKQFPLRAANGALDAARTPGGSCYGNTTFAMAIAVRYPE